MSSDNVHRLNLVEKVCSNCDNTFQARKDRRGKYCSHACCMASVNKNRGSGLPKAEVARRNNRLRNYGITHEDFLLLWERQQGACGICGVAMLHGGRLPSSAHIDHDHETGAVRGILCMSCNLGLGKFYDSPEILLRAIDYLGGI